MSVIGLGKQAHVPFYKHGGFWGRIPGERFFGAIQARQDRARRRQEPQALITLEVYTPYGEEALAIELPG